MQLESLLKYILARERLKFTIIQPFSLFAFRDIQIKKAFSRGALLTNGALIERRALNLVITVYLLVVKLACNIICLLEKYLIFGPQLGGNSSKKDVIFSTTICYKYI